MARTRRTPAAQDVAAQDKAATHTASRKVAKTQIIDLVAGRTSLSRKQSGEAVAAVLDSIGQALREGRSVGIPGLGTFSVTQTAARTGVRPGTSERIQIPAGRKIRFKVATTLRGEL
ncbi:HU family DNA-binding protein [Deinococcus hopiensis]|uniref:DNA-binding protein HU-beta n=1 Tax=Deinococcus hopiensis KR-140 TaxID=695939 RepID=A0A1W1V6T2_9DEIO|nr:HU family DNA-binding protein [Deinococcus hopiensis]SMB88751.1 DNA-binding protein HU-beta [Deinococcus hopiensis KR-140]